MLLKHLLVCHDVAEPQKKKKGGGKRMFDN